MRPGRSRSTRRRRGAERRGDRQRPGQRAVRGGRRRAPAGPRLAPDADRVRDQGGVGRRGRPGPGPGPLPALVGRGSGRARRLRPRVIARTSSRRRSRRTSWRRTSSTAPRSTASSVAFATPARERTASRDGGGPRTYRVATIPGDGVGPEVVAAARRRGRRGRQARSGSPIDWSEILVGGAAIDAYGVAIRPRTSSAARAADAILLGAVGGPKWSDPAATVRPEQALFALRGGLGPVRQPAPGDGPPGARRVVAAPARAARGRRHAHRPRADRRHVLRRRAEEPSGAAPERVGARHAAYTEHEIRRDRPARRSSWPAAAAAG